MIEAYKKFWKGYVDFEGRSTRSDYWFVVLANFLLIMALYIAAIIFAVAGRNQPGSLPNIIAYIFLILIILYAFATILPSLAIQVRRLRDAGYNWPYIFVAFIPFVGGIILIVLLCKPTKVEYPFNNFNNFNNPQQ